MSAHPDRLRILRDFFAHGPRRAEDYLRLCLHEPGFGYYASQPKLGPRGDFSTAATLGTGLGRALARWLEQHSPRRGPLKVIEFGGGTGQLAAQIRQFLPWRWRRRLRLHLVDSSPALLAEQRRRVGRAACNHPTPEAALDACDGDAMLYSNELVDAFPPAVLQWNGEFWDEVGIDGEIRDGRLLLREIPLSCPPARLAELDSVALNPAAWPGGQPPHQQRIEIPASFRRWLADWAPHWRHGRLLTIDYGAPFPQLYQRRPRGTLRGYLRQQRVDGAEVWTRPGQQDLTFDVNFSDLHNWQQQLGFQGGEPVSLRDWLRDRNAKIDPIDAVSVSAAAFQVSEVWR